MMRLLKTLRSNLVSILVALALIGVMVFLWQMKPLYFVTTGSMEPMMPVGTVALVLPDDNLEVGDVITFKPDGRDVAVTHAFIGYAEDGSLMTRGVANPTPDVFSTPLTHDDVIGKVVQSTQLFAPSFWTSPKGFATAGIIAVFVVIAILWRRSLKKEEEAAQAVQLEQVRDESRETSPA